MAYRDKKLRRELRGKLFRCYKGYFAWKKAIRGTAYSRNLQDTIVICFSSDNNEYNWWGLLYMQSYCMKHEKKRVIVVTKDPTVAKSAKMFCKNIVKVNLFTETQVNNIIDLYELYDFSSRHLIVVDLERPYGRKGTALVGKRGITVEDMISVGIYKNFPVKRPSAPIYNGDNPGLREFFDLGESLCKNTPIPEE